MWLGQVIDALQDAGIYDETNFVLVSDHGQRDFVRRLKMNVLLRRGGFFDVDENGKISDWRAFAQSNGMSFSVHLKDKNDKALEQEVYEYLKKLADEGVWGLGKIRTVAEAEADYGLSGPFSFIVETDGYTTFADGWAEPIVNPIDFSDYRLGNATDGYQPETGPQPVFIARGPAFKAGYYRERGRVIDEAPTYATILGDSMPAADGSVMMDVLAEGR
jgi:arylsulfatase A-like enzyme